MKEGQTEAGEEFRERALKLFVCDIVQWHSSTLPGALLYDAIIIPHACGKHKSVS